MQTTQGGDTTDQSAIPEYQEPNAVLRSGRSVPLRTRRAPLKDESTEWRHTEKTKASRGGTPSVGESVSISRLSGTRKGVHTGRYLSNLPTLL